MSLFDVSPSWEVEEHLSGRDWLAAVGWAGRAASGKGSGGECRLSKPPLSPPLTNGASMHMLYAGPKACLAGCN
jgi:hypothetical protein